MRQKAVCQARRTCPRSHFQIILDSNDLKCRNTGGVGFGLKEGVFKKSKRAFTGRMAIGFGSLLQHA